MNLKSAFVKILACALVLLTFVLAALRWRNGWPSTPHARVQTSAQSPAEYRFRRYPGIPPMILWSTPDKGLTRANALRFSPDGQRLISAGVLNNEHGKIVDKRLHVWNSNNGREICRLPAAPVADHGSAYEIGPTLILPDFKTMLTTWGSDEVQPVDIHSFHLRKMIDVWNGRIDSLALSPDGKILAIGATRSVEFRDARSYRLLRRYEHGEQCTFVQFGPNSHTVSCFWGSSQPQTVDVATARQVPHPLWFYRIQDADAFAFSKDGRLLAKAIGNTIEVWRTPTDSNGHKLATFTTKLSAVRTLQFSPDGKVLAVGGSSRTTRPVEFIHSPDAISLRSANS